MTRNEAQARSALAQRARACPFAWGGGQWALTVVPLPDAGPLHTEGGEWRVRAEWAGAPFELAVPAEAAQGWIAARYPDMPVGELSEPFAAAALEAACGELTGALTALQRGPAQVQSIVREAGAGADLPHLFLLEIRSGERAMAARMACGSLGLMLMAGLVARTPVPRDGLPAADVPLLLRAEIGATHLSRAELQSLAIGDAVMIEHAFLTPDAQLWLGAAGWGVRVRAENGTQLSVTQTFCSLELTMPTDTPPGGEAPVPPDQLPVRVAFDVGDRTMTLGELQALQVGQTLELGRPLAGAVNVRVNGALVGTGDLVEIDGRLGVTLTSLAGA